VSWKESVNWIQNVNLKLVVLGVFVGDQNQVDDDSLAQPSRVFPPCDVLFLPLSQPAGVLAELAELSRVPSQHCWRSKRGHSRCRSEEVGHGWGQALWENYPMAGPGIPGGDPMSAENATENVTSG